jgi:hypothetical protein
MGVNIFNRDSNKLKVINEFFGGNLGQKTVSSCCITDIYEKLIPPCSEPQAGKKYKFCINLEVADHMPDDHEIQVGAF